VQDWLKRIPGALALFRDHDLRWSYFLLAAGLVVGTLVNLFLPHGWTAWPGVAMVLILFYVHEAADRNGQGVPPLHVYALFAAAGIAWLILTLLLSALNPLILIIAFAGGIYIAVRAQLRERERRRVIAQRRADGLCIFCGEPADAQAGYCLNCGEEPDPELLQRQRIQAVVLNSGNAATPQSNSRARQALSPETLSAAARRKEAALIRARELRKPSTKPRGK
jgi:hypothetical protein